MNTQNTSGVEVAVELPQYRSHKIVRAAKITGFRLAGAALADMLLGEIGGIASQSPEWFMKHKPESGGYYVLYEDGYASYSPAKAFESGYTPV